MSHAIDRALTHIAELREELAAAVVHGLADHPAYLADLHQDLAVAEAAYICAAVTEIATFRAQLGGPQVG
jgi:hypothetical protein